MLYLSQLLGAAVENVQGERVGRIDDVLTAASQVGQSEKSYPIALQVEGEEEQRWRVPLSAVERREDGVRLLVPVEGLQQAEESERASGSGEREVSLAHEVLDKQVIDIKHKKAVRVNDVGLGDDWEILGIDSSTFGLIRRIAPAWLLGGKGKHMSATLIPWGQIELLRGEHQEEMEREGRALVSKSSVQRAPSGHLAEMHPADIAEIVHQLTPIQGARIIEGLDDETAADTMEEIDTERQRHILDNIQADRAADILEAMGPDEAADLLSQMPEERTQELLRLMTPEESEDVQELLEYEADTAGGLMTTDYIALNADRTVAEAMEAMRVNIREKDVRIAYVYCVADETEDESQLLGVVSLWDLLIVGPTQVLQDIMETDMVTVTPDHDAHAVAEIIAKYNLLAVPVVSEEKYLAGVVTVDDALDVLLPPERRRKPTRMY